MKFTPANVSVPNKVMEHTMLRISTMTDEQLEKRIYKMTNLQKLEAMRIACWGLGKRKLSFLAKQEIDFVIG